MTIMKTGMCLLGATMLLCNCSGDKMEQYADAKPSMDMREYFNGPIRGWGIVQNWKGDVVERFDVDLYGSWDGDRGSLKEDFTYYDGRKQHREWSITQLEPHAYEGTASDIIGMATGHTRGNAMRWAYVMEVPVKGTVYNLTFDDWMFHMHDGVVINRSYLKKFGFTVAELTLFMQKQDK